MRAYATSNIKSMYGEELSFTTLENSLPSINTELATTTTPYTVNSGGNISHDGGLAITARGVCWSTSANPTIDLSTKTNDGAGIGAYNSSITGLIENTVYYIRAYATNSLGTAYGNEIRITTLLSALPTLVTVSTTNISFASATSGGNISHDGNLPVIARGVCWSTFQDPTVELDTKTNNGTGTGSFTSSLAGLIENTNYYVRAYATNSKGTVYGEVKNFTTLKRTIPTISWTQVTYIGLSSANCKVYLGTDGNLPISERGICWSTSPNPIIENCQKVVSGSSENIFECSITDLPEGTKFYAKGYAINSMGIGYGEEVNFTTLKITVPIFSGNSLENISYSSVDFNAYLIDDGNSPLTERGICWSLSSNPSIENGNKIVGETKLYSAKYQIAGLEPNTTYYVVGYAINSKGVGYSDEMSFKTRALMVPKLTTLNASFVTTTSLTIGGSITDVGGIAILDRGVCWSTSPNPTIELSDKVFLGSGSGTFTGNITGLTENTKYYFRSFAINSLGTSYGKEVAVLIYFGNVTDVDGNVYNTLAIGTQIWMKENLKTTKYSNGESIPNIVSNGEWKSQTNGAYCWYNNDINNKDMFGALYNGYTVKDNRKLCPSGWHVPTVTEWEMLRSYLGGDNGAGGKLKATTLWNSPNTGADNSSGFNAFSSGYIRKILDAYYRSMGTETSFWSSGIVSTYNLVSYNLSCWHSNFNSSNWDVIEDGKSVRCLKDQ